MIVCSFCLFCEALGVFFFSLAFMRLPDAFSKLSQTILSRESCTRLKKICSIFDSYPFL